MRLTAADPAPPPGTVVRDCTGCLWMRDWEAGYWLRVGPPGWYAYGKPESWVKVAGTYGPVTIEEE